MKKTHNKKRNPTQHISQYNQLNLEVKRAVLGSSRLVVELAGGACGDHVDEEIGGDDGEEACAVEEGCPPHEPPLGILQADQVLEEAHAVRAVEAECAAQWLAVRGVCEHVLGELAYCCPG